MEENDSKLGGENEIIDDTAFFDVLDCVEEPFDEIEDYYSSDDSSAVHFRNDSSSDESKLHDSKSFDKSQSDPSFDQICMPDEVDLANCEECFIAEKLDNLSTRSPLPVGWKEAYHESGVTLYVHEETNVCSLSRPYFLGTGSTKTHILPEVAIPCLDYRESLNVRNEETPTEEPSADAGNIKQEKVSNYCKRLFKFKKIKYLKFRSWDVRRSYLRTLRNERNRRKCPYSSNKFITFPIIKKAEDGKVISNKKWIINPRGKSYVAILHEYLQQSLKTQPIYTFTEVDNAKTPYAATVIVNGSEYGSGVGMSKKEAKLEAAKATLLVMLPKMKKYIINVCEKQGRKEDESEDEEQNIASVFDDIDITDPRVTKLSKQTTEPTPYELLLKCLQKKGDRPEVKFNFKVESKECTMSFGEHTITVQCSNKRDGKQQAAQALLQALHPYINNWGSLLRLYNNHTNDHYQVGTRHVNEEKEIEEMKSRSPNTELLTSLKQRMLKLHEKIQ
ncbi:hypothetical protein PGB90_009143 [Kerria lacca]